MTLEEEILAIEKEAAATVASARMEAKSLLSAVAQQKERIAKEIASRLEAEKTGIAEDCRARLTKKLSEIERKKQEGIAALEQSASRKSGDCVKTIMKDLLGA